MAVNLSNCVHVSVDDFTIASASCHGGVWSVIGPRYVEPVKFDSLAGLMGYLVGECFAGGWAADKPVFDVSVRTPSGDLRRAEFTLPHLLGEGLSWFVMSRMGKTGVAA